MSDNITLMHPKSAVDNISREEIVNLLVVDLQTRAEEKLKELNLLVNTKDTEAKGLLLQIYSKAASDALQDINLKPFTDWLSVASPGTGVSILGLEKEPYVNLGEVPTFDHKIRISRGLGNKTLTDLLSEIIAGKSTDLGFTVFLSAAGKTSAEFLIPVTVHLREIPDFSDALKLLKEGRAAQKEYAAISGEVQSIDRLKARALAQLTRAALDRSGVSLEPSSRLQIPGVN